MLSEKTRRYIFDRTLYSGQLILWSILHRPDMLDWEEEACREFSDRYVNNMREFFKELNIFPKVRDACKAQEEELGVNAEYCCRNMISSGVRMRMIRPIKVHGRREIIEALGESTGGLIYALYGGIYTLHNDYHMAPEDIKEVCNLFCDFATAWEYGTTNEDLISQFNSMEGMEIIHDEEI